MDKKIVAKKVAEGALMGAVAAAAVIQPNDLQKGGQTVIMALLVGLIRGAYNAWKHRSDGK